jgi:MbtH protein
MCLTAGVTTIEHAGSLTGAGIRYDQETILTVRSASAAKECAVATNPFEDEDSKYLVLVNDEGQHSLWPVFADVPEGWEVIFGEDDRQECLDFIEKNWTDMRPKSLIRQMEANAVATGENQNGTSRNGSAAKKTKTPNSEN